MATARARIPGGVSDEMMRAVVTMGNGDYDMLEYKLVPKPTPLAGEVLVQVLAAGVNNTEINTRNGWYSKSVTAGSDDLQQVNSGKSEEAHKDDGGYDKPTPFPFIQGTDACGVVAQVGEGVDPTLVGKRVLVRSCMYTLDSSWMGSDFDGAFAQFVAVPAAEAFPVECSWTDVELASLPCAYGTSESMLHAADVKAGEHVLIPGASGGVASATIQLAKCRGAKVTAITSAEKKDKVAGLGADIVMIRGQEDWASLADSVDCVVDNVGGPGFEAVIDTLRKGGRYITSGAIAGPIVNLDLRTLYLKNLRLIGSTAWGEVCFKNVINYVEKGQIKPIVEQTFPLEKIRDAQALLLERKHFGKLVLSVPTGEA